MKRGLLKCMIAMVVVAGMTGCASVAKVEPGERSVGNRLGVKLDGAWNHIDAPGMGASEVWTMEGLPVDQLLFYTGIKDGEALRTPAAVPGGQQKPLNFRASMLPDEIAGLFESVLTADGSTFKLVKLEPASFGGDKGFRFEYTMVRKVDSVQLSGLGYGAVHKGELFAVVYMAPTLAFFGRHAARVEQLAKNAIIRD